MADNVHTAQSADVQTQPETWHQLRERYEAALAHADKFHAEKVDPFVCAQKVVFPDWPKPNSPEMERLKAWNVSSGYEAISDEYEKLVDDYCKLSDALITRPAPDAAAALWKFDYLYFSDPGTAWEKTFLKQANKDIRRFLGRK